MASIFKNPGKWFKEVLNPITGASAAEGVAREQAAANNASLDFQKRTRDQALQLAQMTPEEAAQFEQGMALQAQFLTRFQAQLERETKYLATIDPLVSEQGTQALSLLRGGDAGVTSVFRRQREEERVKLADQLRREMGEGFPTSTAGSSILRKFDTETANNLQSINQNAIGQLIQGQGQAINNANNVLAGTNAVAGLASAQQQSNLAGRQNIIGRQISAITNTPVDFQSVISTAGSQYAGDLAQSRFLGQLVNSGVQAAGAYYGGNAGAAKVATGK